VKYFGFIAATRLMIFYGDKYVKVSTYSAWNTSASPFPSLW